jgi:hypothetical protein
MENWGGNDSRREISFNFPSGQFRTVVEAMRTLTGWNTAVLMANKTFVYDYKGVEIALVEVPGFTYYFEAEIITCNKALLKQQRI